MQQKTLVREYSNQAACTTDEQKLGMQGWSVAETVRPDQKPGLLARLRALWTHPQTAAPIVVTYTRGQPSYMERAAPAHLEDPMDAPQVHVGQRVRVNVPGIGDHGQLGTIKKIRHDRCYLRLDWDQRVHHLVWFYAADLEPVPDEPLPAR